MHDEKFSTFITRWKDVASDMDALPCETKQIQIVKESINWAYNVGMGGNMYKTLESLMMLKLKWTRLWTKKIQLLKPRTNMTRKVEQEFERLLEEKVIELEALRADEPVKLSLKEYFLDHKRSFPLGTTQALGSKSSRVRLGTRLPSLSLCFTSLSHVNGSSQGDALSKFYKAKYKKNGSVVDTQDFKPILRKNEERMIDHDHEWTKENDKITHLPGQPPVKFDQYGGYIKVNPTFDTSLYYYFVEANHPSKESLPLLLWLNGGPGCSSIGYGAMEELGPFRVKSDGKTLFYNRFAWNQVANVLFLESPAGVGFSYTNNKSEYNNTGDKLTADESYNFLLNWLERFPEYKTRDFYISGESYAGHYVPQLAQTVLEHNKMANKTLINLKGIIIGNAVIDDEQDNKGRVRFFKGYAEISNEECDDPKTAPLCANPDYYFTQDIGSLINIYNVYASLCKSSYLTDVVPKPYKLGKFDPCSSNYVSNYLNLPHVQKALHTKITNWTACSDTLFYDWKDSPKTTIPILKVLMANGLRVWIYSGDVDGRVPPASSQYSIEAIKLPIKSLWRPWILDQEVGGYTQVYEGDLTYVTVRGAGHEVPSFKPARALTLISSFLANKPLPSN
ncbi:serine carboxypeptidase-like 40 [Impatiens glandulifera]|uniref:serine carboxypeptidase-like 40 n=1 Tax=Impatiens glandulifera TaxID=253017 RepID=UPI001FB0E79A|nr:serine carboxypeptidase-like 40 [Impatiens glandulifera]